MTGEQAVRKTFWKIDGILNCPVVGTCLTMDDQKKLLKKSGYNIVASSDHQIHHTLVQSGKSENGLSRRIQRMLESKYKQQIAELGCCDEETFTAHWKRGLRRGEIDALIWIGATNPNLSATAVTNMFGDYHMHLHGQGVIIRKQLQQLERLQKKNQQLSDALKQTQIQKQQTTQSLCAVNRERATLQQQLQAVQKKNEVLQRQPQHQQLEESNSALADQIRQLQNKLQAQSELVAELKMENGRLTALAAEQEKINQTLRAEFDWLTRQNEDDSACATCPQRDSCACRVLFVGGLETLRPHYQNLVESSGGEFKHVDGNSGSSQRALQPMVGWADIVLCPIDFNSHRACLNVKALCKKMQKPYHMLANSSISHISRVLADLSVELP